MNSNKRVLLELINNPEKLTTYAFLLHAQLFTLSPFLAFPRRRLTSPSMRFGLRRERVGACTSSSVTINPYRHRLCRFIHVADPRQHTPFPTDDATTDHTFLRDLRPSLVSANRTYLTTPTRYYLFIHSQGTICIDPG